MLLTICTTASFSVQVLTTRANAKPAAPRQSGKKASVNKTKFKIQHIIEAGNLSINTIYDHTITVIWIMENVILIVNLILPCYILTRICLIDSGICLETIINSRPLVDRYFKFKAKPGRRSFQPAPRPFLGTVCHADYFIFWP